MNKKGWALAVLIFFVIILLGLIYFFYFRGGNINIGECNDELNNDGDGKVDLLDLDCGNITDNDESNCGDGICEINESCDVDCVVEINKTHLTCSNNSCITVDGDGEDECINDTDCQVVEDFPDLIIENISMAVTSSVKNTTTNITLNTITVSVDVKNIGTASANQSVTQISFGGDLVEMSSAKVFTPALNPNSEVTVKSSYEELVKGKYDATASADILRKIKELDEKNNGFSLVRLVVKD